MQANCLTFCPHLIQDSPRVKPSHLQRGACHHLTILQLDQVALQAPVLKVDNAIQPQGPGAQEVGLLSIYVVGKTRLRTITWMENENT